MDRFAIKRHTECVASTRACPDKCGFKAGRIWAAGLVGLLGIFCPIDSAMRLGPERVIRLPTT
jgi:hypothetical protein